MRVAVDYLMVTVGTSLFSNLSRIDTSKGRMYKEIEKIYTEIKEKKFEKDKLDSAIYKLVDILLEFDPADRILGAEINSIYALKERGFLSKKPIKLVFLVSDTPEGKFLGNLFKRYYESPKNKVPFKVCQVEVVDYLQDSDPEVFKKKGLTTLVRKMGKFYSMWRGTEMGINATGGYKAQIALAVAFGQVMQIPVFYKHERFNQIISFPKVPFTIDLTVIKDNKKAWADLVEMDLDKSTIEIEKLKKYVRKDQWEEISSLLEIEQIDGKEQVSLSPLGLIYWERFRSDFPNEVLPLPDLPKDQKREISMPDHHYPRGFEEYLKKLCRENRFVKGCCATDYSGQQGIRMGKFYEHDRKIFGEYKADNFGARFGVKTDASNELERKWVLNQLRNWYKKSKKHLP